MFETDDGMWFLRWEGRRGLGTDGADYLPAYDEPAVVPPNGPPPPFRHLQLLLQMRPAAVLLGPEMASSTYSGSVFPSSEDMRWTPTTVSLLSILWSSCSMWASSLSVARRNRSSPRWLPPRRQCREFPLRTFHLVTTEAADRASPSLITTWSSPIKPSARWVRVALEGHPIGTCARPLPP